MGCYNAHVHVHTVYWGYSIELINGELTWCLDPIIHVNVAILLSILIPKVIPRAGDTPVSIPTLFLTLLSR